MSSFQFVLRDWVKTSGFLTHELVKRFFLLYPLLCIASDCYLQVQVAFQAWLESIEPSPSPTESQAPVPTTALVPDISVSSAEGHLMTIPSREPERHMAAIRPDNNGGTTAEEPFDVEETPESHPESQN